MIKVLVGGVFDILHHGHVNFLKEAKKNGDYLVVALESDETTKRLKGPGRPVHNQKQRREMLESLNFVDEVISLPEMNSDEDYKKLVEKIKPNIIAITEGDNMKSKKKRHADLVKAKLVEIKKISDLSSTKLAKLIGLE
ncbi:MAG TPA: adenylyltransferase/cytidyltransferase family protein [Patescibacteria group bacterium]|nr:adenylyltransferase/cytidyltransferase family protein [Patescibacteria group bacterium]